MHFGFSYTGLIFLTMLFVPNFIWMKNMPEGYENFAKNENRVLLALERAGEVSVTCLVLIFSDFNPQGLSPRLLWLAAALYCMICYELFWIRYFRSGRTMKDFYSSYLGVPVAGAAYPVAAVFLIAAYGRNPFLAAAGVILGTGHVGIHLCHRKEALDAETENEK